MFLSRILLLVVILFSSIFFSNDASANATCGGDNQRACCVGEQATFCDAGTTEIAGCPFGEACKCGGINPFGVHAVSYCKKPTSCGGDGQRACCLAELKNGSTCDAGLVEIAICTTGNCMCGGPNPGGAFQSAGTCKKPSSCGGKGERACCIGTLEFGSSGGSCDSGYAEVGSCSGDCMCGGVNPGGIINSAGSCGKISSCGGDGQRACCAPLGEFSNTNSTCNAGTTEVSGCTGDACRCGGLNPGGSLVSQGVCRAITQCGGEGQRACCVAAAEVANGGLTCNSGLVEAGTCTGNCLCGGLGLGAESQGQCFKPTSCGGPGERACCIGALEFASGGGTCNAGTVEVPGCEGPDCYCGGTGAFGSSSFGTCEAPTPATSCGGPGERACCVATFEAAPGQTCQGGLVEIAGCTGSECSCGGFNPTGLVNSLGVCIAPSACGGKGQRACCVGTLESTSTQYLQSCSDGLVEVGGCSGDCQCGGTLAQQGLLSLGTCTTVEFIAEPSIGWQAPISAPDQTCGLRGYADLHLHLFGHMAHGGGVLAGSAYDPEGGVNEALRADFGTDEDLIVGDGSEVPAPDLCTVLNGDCGDKLFHGNHLLNDVTGLGNSDDASSNYGAPSFHGWPTWRSATHQTAYYKWLERAWRGGLRLTVMMAVTNEALCKGALGKRLRTADCEDSMASIDAQLDETVAIEAFIDDLHGGPGQGWFRIVRTPAEARQVISEGKLAVLMGIEVDNLFNCKEGECDEAYVTSQIAAYYERGVRHMYPIHSFDNAYGGTAVWNDVVNAGNKVSEGRWFEARECVNEGYNFKLDNNTAGLVSTLGFQVTEFPAPYNQIATCNRYGLSELGRHLIREMIRKGMIIDTDHMSVLSFSDTMDIVESFDYPGVTGSHTLPYDMFDPSVQHERMSKMSELQRIRNVGGMIALMTNAGERDTNVVKPYGTKVDNNCTMSTRAIAQQWQYIVDVMDGPVALGTDFNGIAQHIAPRFGADGCAGDSTQRLKQELSGTRLDYPFSLGEFGKFDQQVTGQRTYDYNIHGLAHVGLMPDFLADMKAVGLSDQDLDPLWRSAEGYIQMWESAAGIDNTPTINACQNVSVTADAFCRADANVVTNAVLNDLNSQISIDPSGPYGLGTNTVLVDVQSCGETSSCAGSVTVVDESSPGLSCPDAITQECTSALMTIDYNVLASDNCGVTTNDCTSGEFGIGLSQATCSASDAAGNQAICNFTVSVIDTQGPVLSNVQPITAECTGGIGTQVNLLAPIATDVCDPEVNVSNSIVNSLGNDSSGLFPLGTTQVDWMGADDSGNTATVSQLVHVVDRLAPTIIAPVDVVAECSGAGTSVLFDKAHIADVCDNNLSLQTPAEQNYALGTTELIWRVTDGSGNESQATQQVTVVDTTVPAITPPADIVRECTSQAGALIEPGNAVSIDVCDGSLKASHNAASLQFALGENLLNWQVTDTSGNSNSAQQTISVVDTTAPNMTIPSDITQECTDATETFVNVGEGQVADVCDGSTLITNDAPNVFELGDNQVTWQAIDASGNTSVQVQTITVIDTTVPRITCPEVQTLECTVKGGSMVNPVGAQATDSCGDTQVNEYGEQLFSLGLTSLNYLATDANGLASSCQSGIEVVDTTPPVIVCPDQIVQECSSNESALVAPGFATTSDVCGAVTVNQFDTATFDLGVTDMQYVARDDQGLQSTCRSEIVVVDTAAPVIEAVTLSQSQFNSTDAEYSTVSIAIDAVDSCAIAVPICHVTGVAVALPSLDGLDVVQVSALELQLRTAHRDLTDPNQFVITLACEDGAGNQINTTTEVEVFYDNDKDGVVNAHDICSNTTNELLVGISGCDVEQRLEQSCPVEGFAKHGELMKCVKGVVNQSIDDELINRRERGAIVSQYAALNPKKSKKSVKSRKSKKHEKSIKHSKSKKSDKKSDKAEAGKKSKKKGGSR